MVLDTDNVNLYSSTFLNDLQFRQVIMHEAGHGLGLSHVESNNSNQLMEPFLNIAFDGPQFDDILNAQRHYGDPLEPNDNGANATPLGALADGFSTTIDTVSLDDEPAFEVGPLLSFFLPFRLQQEPRHLASQFFGGLRHSLNRHVAVGFCETGSCFTLSLVSVTPEQGPPKTAAKEHGVT